MPNLSSASKAPISSSNRKSVFLHEWWLIEVERDSKLGVGGFVNRETLGTRGMRLLGSASIGKKDNPNTLEMGIQVFGSAAIVKRLDNNTLEAVDGITITISGCINRSRTRSNGFSPEVCDRFLSGFPCNWKEYASKSSRDKCADTTERSLPMSFDDLPVTRVRDILLSTTGESEACAFTSSIFRDILKQCGGDSLNQSTSSVDSVNSHEEASKDCNESEVKQEDQKIHSVSIDLHEEVSGNSKETEDDHKQEDGGLMSNVTQKITKDAQAKSPIQSKAVANSAGTSPKSPVDLIDPFSTPVDHEHASRRIIAEECHTTRVSGNKRIATRSQGRYSLRRSTRLKNT